MDVKKALLINTPTRGGNRWLPLQFTSIANDNTTIVDWNIVGKKRVVEEIKKGYDIVGFSVLSNTRWDAFDTAALVRKLSPKSVIVMGGVHATTVPENCKKHCDIVIKGDGELPFADICYGRDPVERSVDINTVWQRYDLLDVCRYKRVAIQATRGCKSKCRFCSSWWVQGHYRERFPYLVVLEMSRVVNYGTNRFYFNDDSFYLDRGTEFCLHLILSGLDVKFQIETRADAINYEYAKLLKRAGCFKVQIGLESGSPEILGRMDKSIDAAYNCIMACKKAGLKINANLIIGNEDETDETIEETRKFLRDTQPDEISSTKHGLELWPGTAVYRKAKREGMIDDDFWDTREPFRTYRFSQKQIDEWNRRVYSYKLSKYVKYCCSAV